jgi:hypothetical protein
MFSSELVSCGSSIQSSIKTADVPSTKSEAPYLESARTDLLNIINRRTENGKRFGILEITAEAQSETAATETAPPSNHIAGFLLDISSSMDGEKISQAQQTIINFIEIMSQETKNRIWFYLITFNDEATVAVEFQEITPESSKHMIESVKQIRSSGSTSYEKAFNAQSKYLEKIMQSPESFNPTELQSKHVHVVKFFETDGDITVGCTDLSKLYSTMRKEPTVHEMYANIRFTYEDVVFGYGLDVDTKILKTLAASQPPSPKPKYQLHPKLAPHPEPEPESQDLEEYSKSKHNCSSFVSISNPKEIGWIVGEIMFKLLTRCGVNLTVNVFDATINTETPAATEEHTTTTPTAKVELFEYKTHTWNNKTQLHSISHKETKTIFVQLQQGVRNIASFIEMIDSKTGYKNQYTFVHNLLEQDATRRSQDIDESQEGNDHHQTTNQDRDNIAMIFAMLQIEIFKLMREIESDDSVYSIETIVLETYKIKRILEFIKAGSLIRLNEDKTIISNEMHWLENLVTDTKVIIGLTAIVRRNEQLAIIHARRTSSAEREFFSTGRNAFSVYIEGEELNEQLAKEIIQEETKREHDARIERAAKAKAKAEANENEDDEDEYNNRYDYEDDYDYEDECELEENDCLPTRIATAAPPTRAYSASQPQSNVKQTLNRSVLRTLCARIQIAKATDDKITPLEIYKEICDSGRRYNHKYDNYHRNLPTEEEETLSSIPDDEHSSRRVKMMRQMSAPISS